MPNYLISAAPGRIVVRNFEGAIFAYPDQSDPVNMDVPATSVADLASVPKITPKLAQRIYDFFHPAPAGEPSGSQGG